MAERESLDDEIERVGRRFTDYVVGHTREAGPASPGGEIRSGRFTLSLERQLIPLDNVEFEQHTTDENTENPDPVTIGNSITLKDEAVERYGIVYQYGQFYEYEERVGLDFNRPIDPARATSLIDALEAAEQAGHLLPITT